MVTAMKPFIDSVIFMRYPNLNEDEERNLESRKWTAGIIKFVDLILEQNLSELGIFDFEFSVEF